MIRPPALVARLVFPAQPPVALDLPLIAVVEIRPRNIQIFGFAAQFRMQSARRSCPTPRTATSRYISGLPSPDPAGRAAAAHESRFGPAEMRALGSTAHTASTPAIAARDQLQLDLVVAARTHTDTSDRAIAPQAEEIDLVHRRVKRHFIGMFSHETRGRSRKNAQSDRRIPASADPMPSGYP